MKMSLPSRMVALLIVLAAAVMVSVPLLSTAQDATPMTEDQQIERGAAIYYTVCVACHQADGNGVPGIFLPLNRGGVVNLDDPELLIDTVLFGRGGMPRFNGTYTDEDIAAILTFIRQEWENDSGPITADEVNRVRTDYGATPIVEPTPEGQIPEGETHPEEREDPGIGTPVSTPAS